MAEQNTENRANEARTKSKQTKGSIEGHGRYLIDSTYTAPDTWISLKKKTRALTTFCSFDLFPTFAPLHYGVAFLSIIQGQRMDFARG